MSSRKAPAQQEIDEEYLRSLMAAPEPAASSSDTEVSEQAETPASEPRVRRSDAEDYASRFLKNTPSEARQCVYIDRRLHRKITTLVGVAGNRRFTKPSSCCSSCCSATCFWISSSSGASWARFASGRRAGRWRVGFGGKPTVSTRRAAAGVGRQPLPLKTMRWSSPGTTAPVSGRQHAPRHATPGARGTIQTRATIHLYRQATAIRNIALCKRPFRGGYIRNLRRSPRRKRTP